MSQKENNHLQSCATVTPYDPSTSCFPSNSEKWHAELALIVVPSVICAESTEGKYAILCLRTLHDSQIWSQKL